MKNFFLVVGLLMGIGSCIRADFEMVQVRDDFDKTLEKNDLVVALVYSLPLSLREKILLPDGSKGYSPEWFEAKRKLDILVGISEDPLYGDQVKFIASNLDRGDMSGLKQDYNLIGSMLMFFRKGKVLSKLSITDDFTPLQVKEFLQKANVSDYVESEVRIKDKKEEEKRARYAKRKSCSSCVNFGLGFGFGYSAWPYGWYGPSYYNRGPCSRWYW